jgi:hypothetical protein
MGTAAKTIAVAALSAGASAILVHSSATAELNAAQERAWRSERLAETRGKQLADAARARDSAVDGYLACRKKLKDR